MIVFLTALFVGTSVTSYAADVNGISISAGELSPGDTFTVTVSVPPSGNADTGSVEVNFSASAFEVTSWEPGISGGIVNSGDGFFVVAAANASRVIDLSAGLELKATLRVKSSATGGSYSFLLTRHNFSYVSDSGTDQIDLWNPDVTKAEVTVDGSSAAGSPEDTTAAAEMTAAAEEEAVVITEEPAEAPEPPETSFVTTTEKVTTSAPVTTTTAAATTASTVTSAPTVNAAAPLKGEPSQPTAAPQRVNPHTGVSFAVAIPAALTGCIVLARKTSSRRKRAKKYIDDEE